MPQRYTITDPSSGRVIAFEWEGRTPPTEADLDDIAAAAGVTRSSTESAVIPSTPRPIVGFKQRGPWAELGQMPGMPAVGEFALGGLKELGARATTLGEGVRAIPGIRQAVELITHALTGMTPEAQAASFPAMRAALAPSTPAEHVGRAVERVGEFLLPGKSVGLAAKTLTRLVPRIGRAAPAIAEGTTAAGVAAAQREGSPAAAGVLGAAGPVVGRVLPRAAAALKESALKEVVQALGPTKERFKALAAKRAPEMLTRRLGGSRQALARQAETETARFGQAIDTELQTLTDRSIPVQPVIDRLEDLKNEYRHLLPMTGSLPADTRALTVDAAGQVAREVAFEPRVIRQVDRVQAILRQYGDTLTVPQAVAIRRVWDDVVARAGGFAHRAGETFGVPLAEQSEAFVKREATHALRTLLNEQNPSLQALNRQFAFWSDLDDVTRATLARTGPQGSGLASAITGATAAAGVAGGALGMGAGVGSAATGAVLTGVLARQAVRVFQSPRYRFVEARLKNRLSEAIMSHDPDRIGQSLGRIAAAISQPLTTRATATSPP